MNNHCLFIYLLVVLLISSVAVSEETSKKKASQVVETIEIGMTPTQVRKKAGMPITTSRTTWKYKDFFIMFEQGRVSCIVDNTCYGKWSNCKSYKKRSASCVIK